jgi:type I restriction enzyme S subunit
MDLDWAVFAINEQLDEMIGRAHGAVGLRHVTRKEVESLEILCPPLPEQRRIAARLREQLAEVAQARAAVRAQLEAAQLLPAPHLREVFAENQVNQWPLRPLGEVAEVTGGITLGRDFRGRPTRSVAYLRVANVKDGWLDLSHIKQTEATEEEIQSCRLRFGDMLLTEGGDPDKLGRGSYWQDQIPECIHQNHIFRVRFDLGCTDPAFMAYQFGSPYGKNYFFGHAKQTTGIATVNRTVLVRFPLRIPGYAERVEIARRLTREKREAENLPVALLRKAFCGQL